MENRFAGYKALCTFGLGSLFWGAATGFLVDLKKDDGLIEYVYLHSIITFILLLNGLVASTFHATAWYAACVAGLGSWSSLILFLGTAHLMSLKFHTYKTECRRSMIVSSVIVTSYWAFSVQDPLVRLPILSIDITYIYYILHIYVGGTNLT